jgi:copper homeostasis protein
MLEDVRYAHECGADGVVFGLLTADGRVDIPRTTTLVAAAKGMQTTFHRAFDMTRDTADALEDVISAGCTRILTSGGRNTAEEGIDTIRELVAQAAGRIEIMAGSGVNPSNARLLAETGVDALHFSARGVQSSAMTYRNPNISMGGCAGVSEYDLLCADQTIIRQILNQLNL